jgi:predicted nucleic acid-binding protein
MISGDTNLFVYAHDNRDPAKQSTARLLIDAMGGQRTALGLQVIGEVQNALRRRLRAPAQEAYRIASDLLEAFDTFAYDERAVAVALEEAAEGRLSYWDALLLAAAASAGVRVMLSEDMGDGFVFRDVEVVNPFGSGGASRRARHLLAL